MKTLLLMRHAKSSWDDKVKDDRDRELSKRGKKNAEIMGELLLDEKLVPDLILASNAVRTRETAVLVMEAMKYRGDVCFLSRLYMAEMEVYVQEIQNAADEINTIMVVGHSPTLDSLLLVLTRQVQSVPTAAVAQMAIPIDSWKDFNLETQAELTQFWRPKELEKKS